jgi:hypothetical protein
MNAYINAANNWGVIGSPGFHPLGGFTTRSTSTLVATAVGVGAGVSVDVGGVAVALPGLTPDDTTAGIAALLDVNDDDDVGVMFVVSICPLPLPFTCLFADNDDDDDSGILLVNTVSLDVVGVIDAVLPSSRVVIVVGGTTIARVSFNDNNSMEAERGIREMDKWITWFKHMSTSTINR